MSLYKIDTIFFKQGRRENSFVTLCWARGLFIFLVRKELKYIENYLPVAISSDIELTDMKTSQFTVETKVAECP